MTNKLVPVIMAGGSGTRLWPLSRKAYPKQFLSIDGEKYSMFQESVLRARLLNTTAPVVVCNEEHRFTVAEQLREIGVDDSHILLEPEGRDTTAAITLAALFAKKKFKDPLLFVLAADHLIEDEDEFVSVVSEVSSYDFHDGLVTFGITPSYPSTQYGYIELGEAIHGNVYKISSFREKPPLKEATVYLNSGRYLWNSGMFLFAADAFIAEASTYCSDLYTNCENAIDHSEEDGLFTRVDEDSFLRCKAISVDYAIMERTEKSFIIPLDAGWNDLGSWNSLWEIGEKDSHNNVMVGDVISIDSNGCYLRSESGLVATIGVEDIVVVNSGDAVIVAERSKVSEIKKLVDIIKKNDRSEHETHSRVTRPWGVYETIDKGSRYHVKRITVNPGAKLSVQLHHHRAEHWVVVSGTAKVTIGDDVSLITENQSTYIPVGQVHALENPGKIPLELIEVQSGSYLSEDDIVRLEDRYGRV